jgi:hypothetical protein
MPTVTASAVPTGGIINLDYTVIPGNVSVSRAIAVSGIAGPFTVLYSANFPEVSPNGEYYIDTGDGLPGPLDVNTSYVYQVEDSSGTAQSLPVAPISSLSLLDEGMTAVLVKFFQAGLNNLVLPPGMGPVPTVTHALPLTGTLALPLVVVYNELFQQDEQQIGEDQLNPDNAEQWTISEFAKYTYRISVLCQDAKQRSFYKLAVVGIFKLMKAYFLNNIGTNVVHAWQAAEYQVSNVKEGQIPAFYGADIMLSFSGTFNMLVTTSVGAISSFSVSVETTLDPSLPSVPLEIALPPEAP